MAETFFLLPWSTLSRVPEASLPSDFACDFSSPDERDIPEGKLVLLSNAMMEEESYPGEVV